MACCAFAVYLLSQLLLPLRWVRDRVFGAQPVAVSAAAAWSPQAVAPPRALRWPVRRSLLRSLIAIELAAAAAAAAAAATATDAPHARAAVEHDFYTVLHTSVCRALGRPQP